MKVNHYLNFSTLLWLGWHNACVAVMPRFQNSGITEHDLWDPAQKEPRGGVLSAWGRETDFTEGVRLRSVQKWHMGSIMLLGITHNLKLKNYLFLESSIQHFQISLGRW